MGSGSGTDTSTGFTANKIFIKNIPVHCNFDTKKLEIKKVSLSAFLNCKSSNKGRVSGGLVE